MSDQTSLSFLEACGTSTPVRLGIEEPGVSGIAWRVFDRPFLVVGSHPKADICLRDPEVSRRHAYFQVIAGRLFCVDLHSRTGTFWDDSQDSWGWANSQALVRIGPYRFRPSETVEGQAPLPISRSFQQLSLPETTLDFIDSPMDRPSWQAKRALILLGRSTACKVQLPGPGVANVHAAMVRTPAGVWIVDLLATGGMVVNGSRERAARLDEDNELHIGTHRIRVRIGPLVDHSPTPALRESRQTQPGPMGDWSAPDRMDSPEALVRTMFGEFTKMQQQMADQFQQALMIMFRSFGEIHQDQSTLIREELARIRELNEEHQKLQRNSPGASRLRPGRPVCDWYRASPMLLARAGRRPRRSTPDRSSAICP